jgi:pimeloyl-ACP methyl ester carboxylesterase
VGHGLGAPGPFKLAFMVNMLAKFGFMRFTSGLLGAGPLIAFTAQLGAIRHRANAKQIDDYKRAYSGRAGEVVYWFKDFRSRAKELSVRVKEIDIPTLVFWGELDVLFHPSNAEHLHAALPQSKIKILPEAGHSSWADQPELFADMVIDWVKTAGK